MTSPTLMPEFTALARPAAAASGPRAKALAICAGVLVLAFVTITIGMRLNDTRQLVALLVAVGVVLATLPLVLRRYPVIGESLARERTLLMGGALLCAALYPFFSTDAYQMHVIAMGGLFALMAIGLNVTTGFAGLAEFGYIAYYAIGAYTSALLNVKLGLNFWICLPLAALLTAALSMLVALPAVRVKGHYLALVTLGFSYIVIQLITNMQWLTGGTQGISGVAAPSLFGHSFRVPIEVAGFKLPFQANYYYLVLALLAIAVTVCARLSRSRWGRAWGAMRADEVAASATGLNLTRLKLIAFGTGTCLGGVAGSIYVHMVGFVDPSTFRHIESIFLLAIVAIGNWRIGGVIAAALLFTILPEKLRAFDEWRLLIFGSALLIVMLWRGRRMLSTNF